MQDVCCGHVVYDNLIGESWVFGERRRGCFLAVSLSNRCTPFFRDMHSVDCFVVLFGRKNQQIVK